MSKKERGGYYKEVKTYLTKEEYALFIDIKKKIGVRKSTEVLRILIKRFFDQEIKNESTPEYDNH